MPPKRIPLLIACLALLTLAGCTGGISSDDVTPTGSESGGDERSTTIPGNVTIIDYTDLNATQQHTDLNATQQQAFDEALSEEEVRLMDGRAWDAPDFYYNYDDVVRSWPGEIVTVRDEPSERIKETYVRQNTTYYRVTVDGPYCCAGKGDRPSLTQVEAPGNQTVTHLANHSGRAWDYLRYSVKHFEQEPAIPGWEVQSPVRSGIIEYQGDYYEVENVQLWDFGRATMSVTKVEES